MSEKEKLSGYKKTVHPLSPDKFNFKKDNTARCYHWGKKGPRDYFLQLYLFLPCYFLTAACESTIIAK